MYGQSHAYNVSGIQLLIMYLEYYGLTRKPFSLTPDPDFLFMSKQHAIALAMLKYGLQNQAGFTLITGEVGSGKTTLIRHLLRNMEKNLTVGVITNTHRNYGDLLTWILRVQDPLPLPRRRYVVKTDPRNYWTTDQ